MTLRTELTAMLVVLFVSFILFVGTSYTFTRSLMEHWRTQDSIRQAYSEWVGLISKSQGMLSSRKPLAQSFAAYQKQEKTFDTLLAGLKGREVYLGNSLDPQIQSFFQGLEEGRNQLGIITSLILELQSDPAGSALISQTSLIDFKENLPRNFAALEYSQFLMYKVYEQLTGFDELFSDFFDALREGLGGSLDRAFQANLEAYVRWGIIIAILGMVLVLGLLVRIQTINTVLDRTIRERTASLNKSLEDLQKTQDVLLETRRQSATTSLIVGLTHEMNTPIGVSLTAESALNSWVLDFERHFHDGSLTRTMTQEFVGRIQQSCRLLDTNLNRLSSHLSMFKRLAVDLSEFRQEMLDLNDFLRPLADKLAGNVRGRGLEWIWEYHGTSLVWTSGIAVAHIINQLVENCLLHGFPPGATGRILVRIDASDVLAILVKDDGQGVGVDRQASILNPFYTTLRAEGHLGLGLNILHNMVTQGLKGMVEFIHTPPGLGVKVTLPLDGPRG